MYRGVTIASASLPKPMGITRMFANRSTSAAKSASVKVRDMDVNFKEENGKEFAEITMPGFSMTDFDRTGYVPPWHLQLYLTGIRVAALEFVNPITQQYFLRVRDIWRGYRVFFVSCRMDYTKDFYDRGTLMSPLKQIIRPGYVGKKSYNTVNEMFSANTGKFLASTVSQLVTIDKETRRPVEVPNWWRDCYKKMGDDVEQMKVDIIPTAPLASSYQFTVPWSDCDMNQHTNMSSYVRFCCDAGVAASVAGEFKNFRGDIIHVPIRSFVCVYKGESVPGDSLTVKSWEEDGKDDTIHHQIFKADKMIFQASVYYFQDMPLLNRAVARTQALNALVQADPVTKSKI